MTLRKCLGMLMLAVSGVTMGQTITAKVGITQNAGVLNVLRIHNVTNSRPLVVTGFAAGIRFGDSDNDNEDDCSIGLATVNGNYLSSALVGDMIMRNVAPTGSLLFGTYVSSAVATERMRIATNGNVGIGISPDQRLHVASSTNTIFRLSNTTSVTDATLSMDFMTRNASGRNARIVAIDKDLNKADLTLYTNGTDNATEPTERMRISANGRVGIATGSVFSPALDPGAQLHVVSPDQNNTLKLQAFVSQFSPSNVGIDFLSYATTGTSARNARIEAVGYPGAGSSYYYGGLAFYTKNDGAVNSNTISERMRITQDGNVGIGITTPTAKLSLGSDVANTKFALSESGANLYGIGYQTNDFRFHLNNQSTDKFSFYAQPTSATSLLTVLQTGKVGIGINNPTTKLSLASDAANTKIAVYESGANLYGFGYQTNDFRFHLNNQSSDKFSFYPQASGGTPIMTITQTGKVGIGAGSPEGTLHVSTSTASTSLKISSMVSSNGAPSIDFNTKNNSGYRNARIIALDKTNNLADLAFYTNGTASAPDGALERMRIAANGNVGIGDFTSTAPASLVTVYSAAPTVEVKSSLGTTGLKITEASGKSTIQAYQKPLVLNPTTSVNGNNKSTSYVAIGFDPAVIDLSNSSTIDNKYQLIVGGKVLCEEMKVKPTTAWPDYVFDKTYQLTSLDSVETFINENKHLPEVPSAFEVKENGIALGDMNAILLKKVEELTLYMIDQKKEMMDQKKEIEALKKKNAEIEAQLNK